MHGNLKQLQTLYSDYIQQCRQLSIDAPYGAGMLSPGKDPRNHPCHDVFYEAVGQMTSQMSRQTEDLEPIIRYMLEVPYLYSHEDACWYLFAVQRHVKPLIPLLDDMSTCALRDWFSQLVPRKHRLPVQEEILDLLTQ